MHDGLIVRCSVCSTSFGVTVENTLIHVFDEPRYNYSECICPAQGCNAASKVFLITYAAWVLDPLWALCDKVEDGVPSDGVVGGYRVLYGDLEFHHQLTRVELKLLERWQKILAYVPDLEVLQRFD